MFKEFKEFALKGNAIELAVGVIIGGAFQSIIKSLVNDIIMPFISLFIGNVNFSEWVWTFGNKKIPYGSFLSSIVNFLLIAFTLFLLIRYINKLNKKIEEAKKFDKIKSKSKLLQKLNKKLENKNSTPEQKTTKLCPYCFSEININATKCPHCTSSIEEEK